MKEVREYLDAEGSCSYTKWFDRLNVSAAVKVTTAVHRMEQGSFSNVGSTPFPRTVLNRLWTVPSLVDTSGL